MTMDRKDNDLMKKVLLFKGGTLLFLRPIVLESTEVDAPAHLTGQLEYCSPGVFEEASKDTDLTFLFLPIKQPKPFLSPGKLLD